MSFILDALRKSETERQRQSGPGLVDAGYRPPAKRRAIWLPVLAIVLAANLILMGVFWLRRAPAPAVVTPPPAGVSAPADVTPPDPAGRSLAAAAGVAAPEEGPYDATGELPALEGEPVTEILEPPAEEADIAGTGAAGSAIQDDLPSAVDLMATGAIPTNDLHLDIHVYAVAPAERFVFINMRKYAEGAQLPQGARIEEITPDGVVLSQDGRRFVLTRD